MFKLLLKTRFSMFFSGNTANKKNKKSVSPKAGKVLMIILFAFLALYFSTEGAVYAKRSLNTIHFNFSVI